MPKEIYRTDFGKRTLFYCGRQWCSRSKSKQIEIFQCVELMILACLWDDASGEAVLNTQQTRFITDRVLHMCSSGNLSLETFAQNHAWVSYHPNLIP